MELIKPVGSLEVKRCFVVSDMVKPLKAVNEIEFKKKIKLARKQVFERSERELDEYILKDPKRLSIYNNLSWYLASVAPDEMKVWERAGGLPLKWTNDDPSSAAEYVFQVIKKKKNLSIRKERAFFAVNGILANVEAISSEKYLLPIVILGGMRKSLIGGEWGIDDGNMRAIALAGTGKPLLSVYIGLRLRDLLIYKLRKLFTMC